MSAKDFADWWGWGDRGVEVVASEFVVTTSRTSDVAACAPLAALLRRTGEAWGMELVLVSEWADGAPASRMHTGDVDALQVTYGRRLLEAGVKSSQFRYHAVPVVGSSSLAHGTLCCRYPASTAGREAGLGALPSVARLIACWFEQAPAAAGAPPRGEIPKALQPIP